MHGHHLVLDIRVVDDDPLVPEVVRFPLEPRAVLAGDRVQHLL